MRRSFSDQSATNRQPAVSFHEVPAVIVFFFLHEPAIGQEQFGIIGRSEMKRNRQRKKKYVYMAVAPSLTLACTDSAPSVCSSVLSFRDCPHIPVPRAIHEFPMGYPWDTHGLPVGYSWATRMNHSWTCPWAADGLGCP